jgi:hypothetical protein
LKDNCAKGLRHLKVAVVWTGQILLYPLQLLARAIEIFPPQLAPPPPQQSLPQPTADINIEQALELVVDAGYPIDLAPQVGIATVDDWSIIDESIWDTGYGMTPTKSQDATYHPRAASRMRSKKPIIRGLSSLLSDRQLVLVTTENELLDLLTISQQQEIRRRIGIDIAIGWHQWRASQLAASQFKRQISTDRQLSIADATTDDWLEIEGKNSAAQALLTQGELELKERASRPPTLRDRLQNWFQNLTPNQSEPSPISADTILELPPTRYPFTPQPPSIDRLFELPQLPPIIDSERSPSQTHPVIESIEKLYPNWLKNWFDYYRDYLYISSKTDSQIIDRSSEFKLIPIEPEPLKVRYSAITTKRKSNITSTVTNTDTDTRTVGKIAKQIAEDLEYAPDWIETDAELIGYSRSPLARFLAWLDRIVLAIENWLIKIWDIITNNPARG